MQRQSLRVITIVFTEIATHRLFRYVQTASLADHVEEMPGYV